MEGGREGGGLSGEGGSNYRYKIPAINPASLKPEESTSI